MIKRTNKIVKQQVTIYIEDWQLDLIDKEAKENEISRTLLISKVLDHHYPKPNTNIKEDTNENGTGTIDRNTSNGISTDEF